MKTGRLFCAALVTFLVASANAASYDCAKASSRIDNAICASAKVSALDSDLHDAYVKALAEASDAEALKIAQRAWLKNTRNACQDEACLVTVYEQRIAAINSSIAAVASTSGATTGNNKGKGTPDIATALNAGQGTTALTTQITATQTDEPVTTALPQQVAVDAAKAEEQKAVEQQAATAQAKKVTEQAEADGQAKKLADEAAALSTREAQQKLYIEIAAGVAAFVLLAGGGWFGLRRRSNTKSVKTDSISRQQAVDNAKKKLASATSIMAKTSIRAAGSFIEELKEINDARNKAFEDGKEGSSDSNMDRAKTLSISFWGNLTGKQKGIVIGVSVLVILTIYLLVPKHKIATPEERDQIRQAIHFRDSSDIKDKRHGFTMMSKLAESGIPESMFYLGLMYEDGDGTKVDINNAMNWYSRGADNGDASSLEKMGDAYINGRGVEIDEKKGLSFLKKSAELGDISAKWEYERLTHTTLASASEARDSLGHTTAESKMFADERSNNRNQDQAQRLSNALASFHNDPRCQALVSMVEGDIRIVQQWESANKRNEAYNVVEGRIQQAKSVGCL